MKAEKNWRDKSIEILEKRSHGDPLTAPTPLVRKCLEYVKIPVGHLSIEQLRLLIGQELSLDFLIPLALEQLDKNILAEGDMYEGDLLKSVVGIDMEFWRCNPEVYLQLKRLIKKGKQRLMQHDIDISHFLTL